MALRYLPGIGAWLASSLGGWCSTPCALVWIDLCHGLLSLYFVSGYHIERQLHD